jgi:dihydrofolate synthase/folylpolyglutamate synthase
VRQHTYSQAEKFLLSREFFGMKLGLENISGFLGSIGDPQYAYRAIHVAGTNGKGSTCAMIASALQAQGYRVGLYTSPHLVNFRERVRVNGARITEPAIQSFVDRHRSVLVKKNSRSLK